MKYQVTIFTTKYSKKKNKETYKIEIDLRERLKVLEKELTVLNSTYKVQEIENIKEEIIRFENKAIKGVMVRARCRWYEKGEKSNE